MKKAGNNYAFIDSQNLNLSIQELGWKLDFNRFRIYLEEHYAIQKAFLFLGYVPTNQTLYTSLQKSGFIIIFKPTLELPDGRVKGNIDAELVLHAMIEFPRYEKAIIVTGDGDFHCLLAYLKDKDKLLKLMVPNRYKYSSLLKKFIPDTVFFNDLKGKLELVRR